MISKEPLKTTIVEHGQYIINLYLFVSFGLWCLWNAYQTYQKGILNFVEGSFIISNMVIVTLFLIRKPYKKFNTNIFDQVIALVAFCSGAALMGSPPTGGPTALLISDAVIVTANILGTFTLLNLGKSFGIFIAYRELKCNGLYRIIRHPMYFTDILLRVGYIISHFKAVSILIFIASTGCYVYRAILEERFLANQPEYAEYMEKVKYRFIPYVF